MFPSNSADKCTSYLTILGPRHIIGLRKFMP